MTTPKEPEGAEPMARLCFHTMPYFAAGKCVLCLSSQVAAWKKAVEGLTPGGSEFVNDPEACAAFIRESRNVPKQLREARAQVAALEKDMVTLAANLHARELDGYREREARIAALEKERDAAREALRPFAEMPLSNDAGTEAWDSMVLKARAALSPSSSAAKPEALEPLHVRFEDREECSGCREPWPCTYWQRRRLAAQEATASPAPECKSGCGPHPHDSEGCLNCECETPAPEASPAPEEKKNLYCACNEESPCAYHSMTGSWMKAPQPIRAAPPEEAANSQALKALRYVCGLPAVKDDPVVRDIVAVHFTSAPPEEAAPQAQADLYDADEERLENERQLIDHIKSGSWEKPE